MDNIQFKCEANCVSFGGGEKSKEVYFQKFQNYLQSLANTILRPANCNFNKFDD